MKSNLSFDIEDWFQTEKSHPALPRARWEKLPLRVETYTRRILAVLRNLGKPVLGYRVPRFPITHELIGATDAPREEGCVYGPGAFPVSLHERYGFAERSALPLRWPNTPWGIPSAVNMIRNVGLSATGRGYCRLLPYANLKNLLRRLFAKQHRFTFYRYPCLLDPGQPRGRVRPFSRFRYYVNLNEAERGLLRLVADFAFERIAIAYHFTEEDGAQGSVR